MKQELMKKTSYKTNNTFMGLIKFMFIMFTFIFMGVFLNSNKVSADSLAHSLSTAHLEVYAKLVLIQAVV